MTDGQKNGRTEGHTDEGTDRKAYRDTDDWTGGRKKEGINAEILQREKERQIEMEKQTDRDI